MSKPIPPCKFCGRDLRRVKPRIIIEDGPRGTRVRWGICGAADCLARLGETESPSRTVAATKGAPVK
jgi:hypothetical protein